MAVTDLESVTPPATGETIATKTIDSVDVQVVLLLVGNGATADYIEPTNPMPVGLYDTAGVAASYSPPVSTAVTPTLSTTPAYAAADSMATAALEFTGAAAASGGRGLLYSVTFIDKDDLTHDGTNGAYLLHLFSATVTPGTANAAYAVADDTELATYIGTVDSDDGTWIDHGPGSACTVRLSPPIVYYCAATSIFGALVAKTLASGVATASGLVVRANYQPA